MTKKLALLTVSAIALVGAGGFLWFDKEETSVEAPVEKVEQDKPAVVPEKPKDTASKKPEIKSKDIVAVPDLSASCINSLADEKLYDKYKLQSYATILPGKNGWFFRTDSDLRQDYSFDDRAIMGFQDMSNALKAKGITLVVALIPPKGLVMPENISPELLKDREFDHATALQSYKDSIAAMRAAGVHFVGVDTFDPAKPFFLKADQHWSQAGTDRMAQAVADYVKTLPVYKELPKQKFQTAIKGPFSYQGKYTEALRKICGVTTANENDVEAITSPVGAKESDSALFGDQPVPKVVLIGTSNSKRDYDSNFDGALKEHLESDVVNNAIAGVGYDDPFLIYLNSPEFKANPPKLIVWEIPGYYQMSGDKEIYKTLPATVWGDCGESAVAKKTIDALPDDKITLFDVKSGDKIPDNSYLVMAFDKAVKRNFTLSFYSNRDDSKRMKFEVSKRTADRFVFMTGLAKTPTNKIIMNVPKEMGGTKLDVKLCTKPGA